METRAGNFQQKYMTNGGDVCVELAGIIKSVTLLFFRNGRL